jgi:glutamyl-tRNA synthetase
MLSVVVDDHDMDVTHVIRGDDHLTNAFRQYQLYRAMEWTPPVFAHIPLIHGPDGAKLSKRHGALGVEAYRDMGYLPEAMRNYLLRLGWGHGDHEVISTDQAIAWFSLEAVGKSPSRFDFAKLNNLNGHYLREAEDDRLATLTCQRLAATIGRTLGESEFSLIRTAMPGLKPRARTLVELAENARFLVTSLPLPLSEQAAGTLAATPSGVLEELRERLSGLPQWSAQAIEAEVRAIAERRGEKLAKIAQPMRAALTGSTQSPPIFDVAQWLGREETVARLESCSGFR